MIYAVMGVIVVIALFSAYRLRQGGPGPVVNGVPRRFRGRLNAAYQRAGWQKPYDNNGDRSPDRSDF
jgi:hypothetical protein